MKQLLGATILAIACSQGYAATSSDMSTLERELKTDPRVEQLQESYNEGPFQLGHSFSTGTLAISSSNLGHRIFEPISPDSLTFVLYDFNKDGLVDALVGTKVMLSEMDHYAVLREIYDAGVSAPRAQELLVLEQALSELKGENAVAYLRDPQGDIFQIYLRHGKVYQSSEAEDMYWLGQRLYDDSVKELLDALLANDRS
ncbi:MAG: hypothetical protein H6502_04760 [Candidatus Woesearchaeota archaeon]|nr:MAG: hypothetical protein H6502_04760 [Candidatus Woesearchaeota archaeon]